MANLHQMPGFHSHFQLLILTSGQCRQTLGRTSNGSSDEGPVKHIGDLDCVSGSLLSPKPSPAIVGICRVNRELCSYLSLSNKQTKFNINKYKLLICLKSSNVFSFHLGLRHGSLPRSPSYQLTPVLPRSHFTPSG